jgi:hypothetical protein
MANLFRDTFAGQAIRILSRQRLLKYPEEMGTKSAQLTLERSLSGTPSAAAYRQWTNHSSISKAEEDGGVEIVSWNDPDDPAVRYTNAL